MHTLWQDLRYAFRTFLKTPSFTIVAIITLALGIGANTAIFTVVNAALLRSLPYEKPDQLYHLWETKPQDEFKQREASYPDYLDWQQNNSLTLAAFRGGGGLTLTGRETAERVSAGIVSANF